MKFKVLEQRDYDGRMPLIFDVITMEFKIREQNDYHYEDVKMELILDKELPIGWFRNKMLLDGNEIDIKPGSSPECIYVSELGDYVGKILEIPDEQIKRGYREK